MQFGITHLSYNDFQDVYVMNADGTGERKLTNDPEADFNSDWSPDGSRIAFGSNRSGEACAAAVYTINPDGTDVLKLTADSSEAFGPAWSPEGDKLEFSDHACTDESDLFVMNEDGTGVTQLFETRANETNAAWSPDSKKIAFDRFRLSSDLGLVPGTGEIYVVGENGKSLTNLTKYPGADDNDPDWSPR
jgi:Tol biopolymer transport system component